MLKVPLCPLHVTVTATVPADPAGEIAVMEVALTTTTLVAALPPNVTEAGAVKFVPVIVTGVPPAGRPAFGDTFVTVGAGAYVKPLFSVPVRPLEDTATFTTPAGPAGTVAVRDVLLNTVTLVAALVPNITVAGMAKFVPVIVTDVPPATGPTLGETLITVGAIA